MPTLSTTTVTQIPTPSAGPALLQSLGTLLTIAPVPVPNYNPNGTTPGTISTFPSGTTNGLGGGGIVTPGTAPTGTITPTTPVPIIATGGNKIST